SRTSVRRPARAAKIAALAPAGPTDYHQVVPISHGLLLPVLLYPGRRARQRSSGRSRTSTRSLAHRSLTAPLRGALLDEQADPIEQPLDTEVVFGIWIVPLVEDTRRDHGRKRRETLRSREPREQSTVVCQRLLPGAAGALGRATDIRRQRSLTAHERAE